SRLRALDSWSTTELEIAAALLVSTVTDGIGAFVSATPREESAVVERTVMQMRLIALGIAAWQPSRSPEN
ncbi:TetR family transcriptional regulator, partial [Streptomyces californicus]